MSPLVWLGVSLLGGCGAVVRVVLSEALGPHGTTLVNVGGALALGLLVGAGVDGSALLLLGGGLLGAFTTFSTWMAEVHDRRSARLLIVALALGVGAAAFGRRVGGLL